MIQELAALKLAVQGSPGGVPWLCGGNQSGPWTKGGPKGGGICPYGGRTPPGKPACGIWGAGKGGCCHPWPTSMAASGGGGCCCQDCPCRQHAVGVHEDSLGDWLALSPDSAGHGAHIY